MKSLKRHIPLIVAAFALGGFCSPNAIAADPYVSLHGGAVWVNELDAEADFTGTAAVGCDYGPARVEAELGYQHGSAGEVVMDLYTLMANGYLQVGDIEGVNIFATAGAGIAQPDVSIRDTDDDATDLFVGDDASLAYQFGAGIAFGVGNGVLLDARYRYFTTLENDQISSHSALLGLRVNL